MIKANKEVGKSPTLIITFSKNFINLPLCNAREIL